MTALPLRDFTDAERDRLAAIEAAPAAEESVRERLAVALYEATEAAEYDEWPDVTGVVQNYVYALADAAIAVLSGPSSDAEQAVERVLQACDREENAWGVQDGQYAWGVRYILATIRAAVAGE